MKTKILRLFFLVFIGLLSTGFTSSYAQEPTEGDIPAQQRPDFGREAPSDARPGLPAPNSGPMAADSPFSDFDARVTIFTLLAGVLVTVLIGGGILILNLGLLSKRSQDRVGGRVPSDVGILKSNIWPEAPEEREILPARDESPREDLDEDRPPAVPPRSAA